MRITTRRAVRAAGVAAAAGLVVAGQALGFGGHPVTASEEAPPTTEAMADDMEMMEPPEYAADWTVELTSDAADAVVTENEVEIAVSPVGYEFECNLAGKANVEGIGHYHVVIDHALVDMSCADTFTVSMQNVAPGEHTIGVHAALNDHTEVLEHEQEFTFTYEPDEPLEELTDVEFDGEPTISVVSPADGDTVSGEFDVVVEVENFNLSCPLYGKPALFGYGHYHVNLDTMEGPMMGMLTMLGMACETTFVASTDGLEPGETHSVIALLTDNGHAPLMNPEAADSVEVTIG